MSWKTENPSRNNPVMAAIGPGTLADVLVVDDHPDDNAQERVTMVIAGKLATRGSG